jgi:hypothetical protein
VLLLLLLLLLLFHPPFQEHHTNNFWHKHIMAAPAATLAAPDAAPGAAAAAGFPRRSAASIACESYLITRPGGNVMVDCPRYNPVLAKRFADLGGVKFVFLTHK